jgi:hypothetical protein
MVDRIIDAALWAVMALLCLTMVVGVLFLRWAASSDEPELLLQGGRTILLELGGLVVVAAVYSIRKRLAAIEVKLNER